MVMEKTLRLLVGLGLLAGTTASIAAPPPPTPQETASTPLRPLLIPPGGGGGGGAPAPAPAASMTYFDRNVTSKTIELDISTGVIEYINVASNTITVQKGTASHSFTIDQVMLQKENGNAAAAAADKAELIAELASPIFTARFKPVGASASAVKPVTMGMMSNATSLGAGTDATHPGLKVNAIFHGLAAPNVTYAKMPTYTPMLMPPDGGGGAFGCDMDFECDMADLTWGSGGGGMDFYYYEDGASGGTPNTSDYQYFVRWRADRCSDAHEDEDASLEDTATIAIGCATAETGVGAVACAVGVVGFIHSMNKGADDSRMCLEQYPGPGAW